MKYIDTPKKTMLKSLFPAYWYTIETILKQIAKLLALSNPYLHLTVFVTIVTQNMPSWCFWPETRFVPHYWHLCVGRSVRTEKLSSHRNVALASGQYSPNKYLPPPIFTALLSIVPRLILKSWIWIFYVPT